MSRILKRTGVVLTLFLFAFIYSVLLKVGVSGERHMFSILIASYFIWWGGYSLISSTPREEIRNRFVLVTFSLGITLLLLELPVSIKLLDYRQVFSNYGKVLWDQPGYLPDPELLGKPQPHHAVQMEFSRGNIGDVLCLPSQQADRFELRYDRNGFRNEKELEHAQIAVIGDSYVESEMFPTPMLMTTHLGELTGEPVVNLGISGYGPQQELAVLKRYALPLQPKTVIWVFYEGNDLVDAERYPEMVSFLQSNWDDVDTLWDRSFSKNALIWLTRTGRGCVPITKTGTGPIARAMLMDTEGNKRLVYVKGGSRSATLTKQELEALKTTVEAIKEGYRLAQAQGTRLIVAFAPTAFRVYNGIADFKDVGDDAAHWNLNDLPDRLRAMISDVSSDIGYIDLTPQLESAARKHQLVFLPDDTHWSVEGHRVVAQTIVDALADRPQSYAGQPNRLDRLKKPSLLSDRAILVRNLDGTIRYWSEGARHLYGWEPRVALGTTSHQLLKTIFPVPLQLIDEELRTKGHWNGPLIHERQDGSKVTVMSHWDLQQNPQSEDRSTTVVEINGPT